MIKVLYSLLLILIGLNCKAQSIATALSHDRSYDIREEPIVSKIISYTTYYRKNETEKKRTVSIFNETNMLSSELRYDKNGKLIARLIIKYDSTKTRSLSRKFETWNRVVGHSVEIADYIYDENNFLIKTIDKNRNNQIFRITTLENNERGHPEKLTLQSNNFNFSGIENAKYNYQKNVVDISVLDDNGKAISTNKMRINFSERKFDDLIYNKNLIKSKNKEYSYKYDKNNNWIRKTNYEYKNGKKRKYQTITRKIKYKK